METVYTDDGKLIEIGTRVRVLEEKGTVTNVSDTDGDVDDYGRSYGIPPYVTVAFDDGVEDSFACQDQTPMSPYYYEVEHEWVCGDLDWAPTPLDRLRSVVKQYASRILR